MIGRSQASGGRASPLAAEGQAVGGSPDLDTLTGGTLDVSTSPRAGFRSTLRAFDTVPFRFLFVSNLLFFNAQFIFLASQQWLVVNLTNSRTLLGLVGFAQGIAMMIVSPFAGVVTDRLPRRRILLTTRSVLVGLTVLTGTLAALHVIRVWHVLVVALAVGMLQSSSQPATQSYVFDVVPSDRVANAVALNSATTGISQMIGPSLGGVFIAALGVFAGYYVSAGFYTLGIVALLRIPIPGAVDSTQRRRFLVEMREGAAEAFQNPVTRWVLLLVGTSFCASAIQAMRPVFAKEVFDVGAFGFGAMSTAFGIGGLAGAIAAANLSGRIANKGALLLCFGTLYYTTEVMYGLAPTFHSILVVEFFVGFASTGWGATAFPLMMMAVPAEMRGRVMSVVFAILPGMFIGQLVAGKVADGIGPRATVTLFGCIAVMVHIWCIARRRFVRAAAHVQFG